MKDKMLKIAGVKSEKEFYNKYPSEEAFMKAHGKEFRKAKLGEAIPKNQNAKFVLPKYDMPRAASESTSRVMNTPTGSVNTATTGQKKKDVAAGTKAMGNAKKKEFARNKKQQELQKSARESEKYNTDFTFPNGTTKQYSDMTAAEKAYVAGEATKDVFEIDALQNPTGGVSWNDFNPLDFVLGEMAGNLGTAPYEAQQAGSILPVLGAVADPLMTGAIFEWLSPGKSLSGTLKDIFNPAKNVKDIAKLAVAAGEDELVSEASKQAVKKGSKKLKNVIVDEFKVPEIPTKDPNITGEGNIDENTLIAQAQQSFKQGGQLRRLQQLTDFGNPPKAQFGCHGDSKTMTGEGMQKQNSRLSVNDGSSGGGVDYAALNAPTTWEELQKYNETDPKSKEFKNQLKALQAKFPGLTQQQLLAAGADSARIRQRMSDLKRYDKPEEQTFDKSYHQFYRPLMDQKTPVTIPQILETFQNRPGGLSEMESFVRGNYGRPKAQDGSEIGSYTGGETMQAKPIAFNDVYAGAISNASGLSAEDAKRAALLPPVTKSKMDWAGMLRNIGGEIGKMEKAKGGKKVPKFQTAPYGIPANIQNPYGQQTYVPGQGAAGVQNYTPNNTGLPTTSNYNPTGTFNLGSSGNQKLQNNFLSKGYTGVGASGGGGGMDIMGKLGGVAGIANSAAGIIEGIQGLKEEKKQLQKSEADKQISALTLQASGTRAEQSKRRYNRPEDALVQPDQLSPSYGVGTNVLGRNGLYLRAQDGQQIGGNETEIQNMYNPGDIYSDLGYEPLSDSEIVKQYRAGGFIHKAQFGLSQFASGGGGDVANQVIGGVMGGTNAGGKLGGSLGKTAGSVIGGPIGGMIGGAIGTVAGNLLDKKAKKIEANQEATQKNVQSAALQSGAQALQGQNAGYMEHGGWVSHDWQPQVITQFGEYSMKDLLRKDPMMDTLRTGGNITQNNMFPQDQYAMGGELKTTWGGHAETMSQNPYLPGTGETVMFRGKSHEESDGNGHTGIGVKYGQGGHDSYTDYAEYGSEQADADVEVERGEPATEMIDGETGEKNMVVFGNLKIPNQFLSEINDPKAKGKKFKNFAADLSKIEARQNKIKDKALTNLSNLDDNSPFGLLSLNSYKANFIGGDMMQQQIAQKKMDLAAVQNAINDTAEEYMLDADHLAKGKLKIDKEAMKQTAKYGKNIPQAQDGWTDYLTIPGIANRIREAMNSTPVRTTAKTTTTKTTTPPPAVQLPTDEPAVATTQAAQSKTSSSKSKTTGKKSSKSSSNWNAKSGEPKLTNLPDGRLKFTNADGSYYIVEKDKSRTEYDKNGNVLGTVAGKSRNLASKHEMTVIPSIPESDNDTPATTTNTTTNAVEAMKRSQWIDAMNQLLPYVRPTDQEDLDMSQLYPEMMALSMNTLEPVPAQGFQPQLKTPYDISLQDQLNEVTAQARAAERMAGQNPAAAAAIMAQASDAKNKILGEQFRMNQAQKAQVYGENINTLNQSQLQNLGIFDKQYERQAMAKSRTKEQALEVAKSMADKIAKNKLENRQLGIMENLYNYRFDKSGRAVNMNPLAQFDVTRTGGGKGGGLASGLEFTYDANGNIIGTRKTGKDDTGKNGAKVKSRNGSIVQAIKSL